MSDFIEIQTHRERILAAVTLIETETLSTMDARGRVTREPVRAAVDIPVFDNSAMDGFAVRYDDVRAASACR